MLCTRSRSLFRGFARSVFVGQDWGLTMNRFLFAVVTYIFVAFWSTTTLLGVFLRVLWDRKRMLKKLVRDVPPECLLDPSLGEHEYINANGLRFHYVTAGDRSKPLMLFLHGFPEFWFSWRQQIKEFSKEYHVVAIDMRGYGETERPPNKLDYTISKLTQDIVELIPALGYSSCVLVGHDWGAVVTWSVVNCHPHLVDRCIVMNTPHPRVFKEHLTSHWSQFMKSWYMFMFQVPWLPEFLLRLRDYGMFNAMFTGKKAGARNKAAFPPDVIEAFKYTFSQPGALTGPINYIRCVFQAMPQMSFPIKVPVLLIWGDDDAFLDSKLADSHASVATNITVRHIPNCSHWVQQDAPDLTNQYMKEFLEDTAE